MDTTDLKHGLPLAPNLLDRNFGPAAPTQVWTAGIMYLWTDEGWLYLAIVPDLFNRDAKDSPTFSDTTALVRRSIWGGGNFWLS